MSNSLTRRQTYGVLLSVILTSSGIILSFSWFINPDEGRVSGMDYWGMVWINEKTPQNRIIYGNGLHLITLWIPVFGGRITHYYFEFSELSNLISGEAGFFVFLGSYTSGWIPPESIRYLSRAEYDRAAFLSKAYDSGECDIYISVG